MSSGLDLGPILDLARSVAGDALDTMGTVVTLSRPAAGSTVDPDTALATTPADVVLAKGVPAIIVPDAPGGETRVYPGAPQAQDARTRIILPPDVVELLRGDRVAVTASRDQRLIGGVFMVNVLLDNAAGAVRVALGHRVPVRGQT